LGEIVKGMQNANNSGMDTIRLAGVSGMSTESTRGLEYLFQSGGMTKGGSKSTILAAGQMRTDFNTSSLVENSISNMVTRWGSSQLDQKLGFTPQISDFQNKSTQEILATVQGWSSGLSREDRTQMFAAINPLLDDMTVLEGVSSEEVANAKGYLNEDGTRSFTAGNQAVRQTLQTTGETLTAATGEVGGAIAATAEFALGSKTLNIAANKLLTLASAGGTAAAALGGSALLGGAAAAGAAILPIIVAAVGAGAAYQVTQTAGKAYDKHVEGTGVGDSLSHNWNSLKSALGFSSGTEALDKARRPPASTVGSGNKYNFDSNDLPIINEGWSPNDLPSLGIEAVPSNHINSESAQPLNVNVHNKNEITVSTKVDAERNSVTSVNNNGDIQEQSERNLGYA
jgi:hypothetical protein